MSFAPKELFTPCNCVSNILADFTLFCNVTNTEESCILPVKPDTIFIRDDNALFAFVNDVDIVFSALAIFTYKVFIITKEFLTLLYADIAIAF